MSKELKVGLLAIVAGVLLYFGFNYLKGIDFFSGTNKYYVNYDHISGLTVSNSVIVSGLTVGRVSDITLDQRRNIIVVQLDVNQRITIGEGAIATLANSDLLGGKAIQLNAGNIDKPINPGDTIEGKIDDELAVLLESTEDVAVSLGVTIGGINEILKDMEGSGIKIKSTFEGLDSTLAAVNDILRDNRTEVAETIAEMKVTAVEIRNSVSRIAPILEKTDILLDSLNQIELRSTLSKTDSLIVSLTETVNMFKTNDGTLGKLMSEDTLYTNLNQLLIDLDKLTNHFNDYPRDFLKPLGRKKKKLKGNKEGN